MAYFPDEGAQGIRYSALVDCGGVLETHGHHAPFVCAEGSGDRGFMNVIGVHAGLEKGVGHVDGCPDLSSSAICEYVIYTRHAVGVGNCVGI